MELLLEEHEPSTMPGMNNNAFSVDTYENSLSMSTINATRLVNDNLGSKHRRMGTKNAGQLIDYSQFNADAYRPNTSSGPSKGLSSLNHQRTRS